MTGYKVRRNVEEIYPIVLGLISTIVLYNFDGYDITFCLDKKLFFIFSFFFSILFSLYCLIYVRKKEHNERVPFIRGMREAGSLDLFERYVVKNMIWCLIGQFFWIFVERFADFRIYDFILLLVACCGFFTTWRIVSLFVRIMKFAKIFRIQINFY